jgi:hypothetical protein
MSGRGAGGRGQGERLWRKPKAFSFAPRTVPPTSYKNYGSWLVACGFWLLVANSFDNSAFSQNLTPKSSLLAEKGEVGGVRPICSEQTLEIFTTQLLRDLPSYANRASQRARRLKRSGDVYSYVLVAGRPEFQPLPLNPGGRENTQAGVKQVFFTTLERQYVAGKVVESQQFHRLLLTKTKSGWRLVMMFTQTGAYLKQQPQSPPRDSSNSAIAQGIKAWLRDCQAGSVHK